MENDKQKSVLIRESVHNELKKYCKRKYRKIGGFVEEAISEKISREIQEDQNK